MYKSVPRSAGAKGKSRKTSQSVLNLTVSTVAACVCLCVVPCLSYYIRWCTALSKAGYSYCAGQQQHSLSFHLVPRISSHVAFNLVWTRDARQRRSLYGHKWCQNFVMSSFEMRAPSRRLDNGLLFPFRTQ